MFELTQPGFLAPPNFRVNPTRVVGTPLTRDGEIQFRSTTGTEKYSFAALLGRRNFSKLIGKFPYAHIEIVVAFSVVIFFGFWVITRSPLPWI